MFHSWLQVFVFFFTIHWSIEFVLCIQANWLKTKWFSLAVKGSCATCFSAVHFETAKPYPNYFVGGIVYVNFEGLSESVYLVALFSTDCTPITKHFFFLAILWLVHLSCAFGQLVKNKTGVTFINTLLEDHRLKCTWPGPDFFPIFITLFFPIFSYLTTKFIFCVILLTRITVYCNNLCLIYFIE